MTYLFHLVIAVLTVNGWAVCRVTNPLQDCCFSRICSSYDEDSEFDLWNRVGQFRIHCFRIDWRATESGIDLNVNAHWQVHTLIKQYEYAIVVITEERP